MSGVSLKRTWKSPRPPAMHPLEAANSLRPQDAPGVQLPFTSQHPNSTSLHGKKEAIMRKFASLSV